MLNARVGRGRFRKAATLVALIGVLAAVGSPAGAAPDDADPAASPMYATAARGADAVARAHGDLRAAAARNGLTEEKLQSILDHDDTAWLDRDDHLFYQDPVPPPPPDDGAVVAPAPFPYSSTFSLHSRPGSSKVIYLDFDGHSITTPNGWFGVFAGLGSSYTFGPFDFDADPTTFSSKELDAIQAAWQLVAEDYAPFDVDVTTADPGVEAIRRTDAADTHFGTRAVLTTSPLQEQCRCGGIAFLGAFDAYQTASSNAHDYYQPAIIFSRIYSSPGGYYYVSARAESEAISHEVGHNLGLSHDGTSTAEYYTGSPTWAPIMGAGYTSETVQFSKGEYADANNHEDDFAVMLSHGLTLVPDDVGDTLATARPMGQIPTTTFDGMITSAADADVFEFTPTGGEYQILVTAAQPYPNLSIKLEVLYEDGTVEATNESTAVAFLRLTNRDIGIRYARVSGTGLGDPATTGYSNYGSVGRYHLDLTQTTARLRVVTSPPVPAAITVNGAPADQWGLWSTRAPGSVTVCFGRVPGFDTPPCQANFVAPNSELTITGTYTPRGQLRVITQPAVASTISVDGLARNDWGMWTDFPTGPHRVCFGLVAGFDPPPCQDIVVAVGQTTLVTGTFAVNASAPGDTDSILLRVRTNPAVPTQIGLSQGGDTLPADTWGLTWVKLPRVRHTLCISDVAGFAPLAAGDQCRVVWGGDYAPGTVLEVAQSFTQIGTLRVITSPPSPTTIVVDGLPRNDWGMWTDFPNGQHTVCFTNLATKKAPPCQTVTVNPGQTTTVTGSFS